MGIIAGQRLPNTYGIGACRRSCSVAVGDRLVVTDRQFPGAPDLAGALARGIGPQAHPDLAVQGGVARQQQGGEVAGGARRTQEQRLAQSLVSGSHPMESRPRVTTFTPSRQDSAIRNRIHRDVQSSLFEAEGTLGFVRNGPSLGEEHVSADPLLPREARDPLKGEWNDSGLDLREFITCAYPAYWRGSAEKPSQNTAPFSRSVS
jgi:hypothetical protein